MHLHALNWGIQQVLMEIQPPHTKGPSSFQHLAALPQFGSLKLRKLELDDCGWLAVPHQGLAARSATIRRSCGEGLCSGALRRQAEQDAH